MKAFYFATNYNKLRYGDGRSIEVGTTHSVNGAVELCRNGLHASTDLYDALKYAPGSQLYLVELSGEVEVGRDKVCAQHRKYVARFDATNLLRRFAREQALLNVEKITPYCTQDEYALICSYLSTGDEGLQSAARSAARSAAWSAESAAWSAESAAWSAESAAWSAESAAWSAARAAAWAAARAAAGSAAGSAAWSAAGSAAWSAARAAAESAARDTLTQMLVEATGWEL